VRVETRDLSVRYGAIAALTRVSIAVDAGQRCAVIGPNGAGKTTLFGAIAGTVRAASGEVLLGGREVTSAPAWKRAALGLGRTFQRSTLFADLTVAENVALAVRARRGRPWRPWPSSGDRRVADEVADRLGRAGLAGVAAQRARRIGHGEQRALELEVALARGPGALLLDEPMAGLAGGERQQALERLRALPREVTVVIVEHDLDAVFAVAERVCVLDHGELIADGTPQAVRADRRVQEVYLGV
jgi:branched-chain amino acid transport system ATP-binding protein